MQQHGVVKKPIYPRLSPPQCWSLLLFISCRLIFRSPSLISVSIHWAFLKSLLSFSLFTCPNCTSKNEKSHVWYHCCIHNALISRYKVFQLVWHFCTLFFFLFVFCLSLSLPIFLSFPREERGEDRYPSIPVLLLPKARTHTHTHTHTQTHIHSAPPTCTEMQVHAQHNNPCRLTWPIYSDIWHIQMLTRRNSRLAALLPLCHTHTHTHTHIWAHSFSKPVQVCLLFVPITSSSKEDTEIHQRLAAVSGFEYADWTVISPLSLSWSLTFIAVLLALMLDRRQTGYLKGELPS